MTSPEYLKSIHPAWMPLRGSKTLAVGIIAAALVCVTPIAAAPPFPGADAFIQKNCVSCHSSLAPAARLDLTKLAYEPSNPDNFATWVKVHDRVSAAEMPPRAMPRPPADSVAQFVKGLSAALTAYERGVTTERGRAGLRRLNAYEYENAVRDFLNVPWVQIKSKLPQDGEAWRYNKIGTALDVSYVQPPFGHPSEHRRCSKPSMPMAT